MWIAAVLSSYQVDSAHFPTLAQLLPCRPEDRIPIAGRNYVRNRHRSVGPASSDLRGSMACVGGDLSGERDLAGRSSAAVRGCRPHPRWRVRRVRFEEVKRNKTENEKGHQSKSAVSFALVVCESGTTATSTLFVSHPHLLTCRHVCCGHYCRPCTSIVCEC